MQDTIAAATRVNLYIGVIADAGHSTQLHLLSAMVQAASVVGAPAGARGALQYAQIAMIGQPPSPLSSVASGHTSVLSIYGGSPAKSS